MSIQKTQHATPNEFALEAVRACLRDEGTPLRMRLGGVWFFTQTINRQDNTVVVHTQIEMFGNDYLVEVESVLTRGSGTGWERAVCYVYITAPPQLKYRFTLKFIDGHLLVTAWKAVAMKHRARPATKLAGAPKTGRPKFSVPRPRPGEEAITWLTLDDMRQFARSVGVSQGVAGRTYGRLLVYLGELDRGVRFEGSPSKLQQSRIAQEELLEHFRTYRFGKFAAGRVVGTATVNLLKRWMLHLERRNGHS